MMKRANSVNLKLATLLLCFSLLSNNAVFAVTQAKMNASVDAPTLRGAYASPKLNNNSTNIKLEGDISLTKGNQIISVSLRDSDVKQALRMFADKAGLNIVFHKSVDGKITMDLVNVTLNNAFKMIMQMAELSYVIEHDTIMVMSAEASKTMSVSMENMSTIPVKYADASSLAQFLNKNIFSSNKPGLSNNEIVVANQGKNELIIFGTPGDYKMAKKVVEKLDTKPTTTIFKVNHSTPKEMATMLCQSLFPNLANSGSSSDAATGDAAKANSTSEISLGGGVLACRVVASNSINSKLTSLNNSNLAVIYHPGQGSISLIGGSSEQVNMVNEFIASHDKKQPQAYIEFSIVELSEDGSRSFNNNWNIASQYFSAGFSNDGLVSNSLHPTFWKGSSIGLGSGTSATNLTKYSGPMTVSQSISYLISNGKGRVLANPKVMVTNGQKSIIDLTSDYVASTTSQVISGSTGVTSAVQKTYTIDDDNGIKVEMIPFISPDGYVSLNLKPDYATIKEQLTDIGADGKTPIIAATLLQRRNLELSNVRIKDGETLVIGGLIQENESQKVVKMPILGELPIIGVFFRNSQKTLNKSELVIMITPRIIVDTEDVTRL